MPTEHATIILSQSRSEALCVSTQRAVYLYASPVTVTSMWKQQIDGLLIRGAMAKQIPLTKGKFCIVDDEDYLWLSQWKWCASFNGSLWYAQRSKGVEGALSIRKTVQMHRFITQAPKGMEVDHINGDTLDNRRENLRLCVRKENGRNRRVPKNNTSGFKGVWWNKTDRKWEAEIRVNNKRIYLGHYTEPEDAARAYDKAAIKYFGAFAKTNFKNG